MRTKEQNISINTLLAASIGCFIQLALGVFVMISPFLLINLLALIYGKEAANRFLVYLSTPFTKDPITFTFGLIFLFIIAVLFLLASKKIKKHNKVQIWSVLCLISSFLLVYFRTNILEFSAILGFIGSVTGLMYKEEINS